MARPGKMSNIRLLRKKYLVRTSLEVLHNPTQVCVVLPSPFTPVAHNDHTTVYMKLYLLERH